MHLPSPDDIRFIISNWWRTIDKTMLFCIGTLLLIGICLTFSASPAVALRNHYDSFHFITKHLIFAPLAALAVILVSMQRLRTIRRVSLIGYLVAMALVVVTLIIGEANKGASRWINILGISLQPSEFVKPFFIITAAWLFTGHQQHKEFPGHILSIILFVITAGLIVMQPDLGMTIVVSTVWVFQFFLCGLPWVWVFFFGGLGISAMIGAYFVFPHFQIRCNQYMASGGELSYQIKKSLQAFQSGNMFGRGPGEGIVRSYIPDAHTDFIYAVAGEEYGIFLCTAIVVLYATIVIRGMIKSCKDNDVFIILTASGLALSFGLQSIINMASTLHIIPTKGMTLPFISYGGSSTIASGIAMGMLLAITRKNIHAEEEDQE